MRQICVFVSLLLACPALSTPLVHLKEVQDIEQAYLGARARHVVVKDAEHLLHPRVVSEGDVASSGNKNDTIGEIIVNFFHQHKWMYGVAPVCGLLILAFLLILCLCCYCLCYRYRKCGCAPRRYVRLRQVPVGLVDSTDMITESHQAIAEDLRPKRPLEDSPEDNALQFFLDNSEQYESSAEKLDNLGSRMQKSWYTATFMQGEERTRVILTVALLSTSCPLQMHKHQKGLNKLLRTIKVHPFIHPVLEVSYLANHEKLVIVQPQLVDGSLKDLIYKVSHPTLDWSQKYGCRSSGLPPDKVARFGRQILEAMMFLYHKGFPTNRLGHVQSGNIFVINNVCRLGGYENTLLGYKTRLFRLCRDHMEHLDTILFGHLIFEMSAGFELQQLKPGMGDYKTVHKAVKPVLEFIFDEEFSHSISEIIAHDFFDVLLPEMKDFSPSDVQLTDSMRVVLEKVRKNKPRVQKTPSKLLKPMSTMHRSVEPQMASSWKDRLHMPKLKQLLSGSKKKEGESVGGVQDCADAMDDDEPLLDLS